MRLPGFLLLSTLAACATSAPGVDPEWRQIQAERLERLHAPRHTGETLARLLGQDPQPATGRREPRHIDQREPVGMRQFREPKPSWVAHAMLGYGDIAVRVNGSQVDDRVDATFLRAGIESANGTAFHLEAWSTDSDLFAGSRINDGVAPANADATLRGMQFYPHVVLEDFRSGAFGMPTRLGLYAEWQRLSHDDASVEREWTSLGPRLLLEPTLRLFGDDGARVELVGRAGGELGPTWFAEEFRGGDDHDVTSRWALEVGLALRAHIGRMRAELGYDLHHAQVGPTDTSLLGDRDRTEFQRQQLFFGLGLEF